MIPCFLVPNKVYTIDNRKYVNISWDPTQFATYNINIEELIRYSKLTIRLVDLYPNTNSSQLTYAQACMPNLIANTSTFENDELVRFQTLVNMILNTTNPITSDTFYKVADFLSYEVLFLYLQTNERHFMLYIATHTLTSGNVDAVIAGVGGITTIIPFLKSCLTIFTSYAYIDTIYNIQNIMNLALGITFPLQINVPLMQANIQFLSDNGYLP
jgi:hypothetical protein